MVKRLNETIVRTEREIDHLYPGQWVLLDERDYPHQGRGRIVAIGENTDADLDDLLNIKLTEFKGKGHMMCGCPNRGEMSSGIQFEYSHKR
ncbi:MAG: hypothetical protein FWE90_13060 [Defluviitaleaceae bacterium]|nr:hypothetical protein [Defluviitaleaceae bacterium]